MHPSRRHFSELVLFWSRLLAPSCPVDSPFARRNALSSRSGLGACLRCLLRLLLNTPCKPCCVLPDLVVLWAFWGGSYQSAPCFFGTAVAAVQAAVSTHGALLSLPLKLTLSLFGLRLLLAWCFACAECVPNTLEHRLVAFCCEQVHGHPKTRPLPKKGQNGLRAGGSLQCLRQA